MNGAERKSEGVIGWLERGGGLLGQLGLIFMVVSISYDVIMRYVFVAPTHWALEVNTFLLVFLCVIPAGNVLRVGSQIRITFLYDRLRPAVSLHLDRTTSSWPGKYFSKSSLVVMVWSS